MKSMGAPPLRHSTPTSASRHVTASTYSRPTSATKEELIDYAVRTGLPLEVIENLEEIEDEGDIYESIEEVWPDYPSKEDFLFNEDEY